MLSRAHRPTLRKRPANNPCLVNKTTIYKGFCTGRRPGRGAREIVSASVNETLDETSLMYPHR